MIYAKQLKSQEKFWKLYKIVKNKVSLEDFVNSWNKYALDVKERIVLIKKID